MKVKAQVKLTGEHIELRSYSFGYIDCKGTFYPKCAIKVLEVIKDE
jgi:hypothetical protein